jgi:flagellar hook assembly protein FlgD
LAIENANGELVKVLIDDTLPPGQHAVIWNGTDHDNNPVASGVYFVRATASGVTEGFALTLIK